MSLAPSIRYRYFAVDADHDITADPVTFSADAGVTWLAAAWVTDGPTLGKLAARVAGCPAEDGLTRYWAKVLCGPNAGQLPLRASTTNDVLGKVSDSPQELWFRWDVWVDL